MSEEVGLITDQHKNQQFIYFSFIQVVVPKFDASARKKKRTTKKRVTPKAEPTATSENEITTSAENPAVEETDVTPSTKTENGNEDYAYDFVHFNFLK